MFQGVFNQSTRIVSRQQREGEGQGEEVINASNGLSDFLRLINVDEPRVNYLLNRFVRLIEFYRYSWHIDPSLAAV